MLFEEDDDFLVGSPKSKFFDIVFNANRGLVEESFEVCIEKYVAMEHLLEKLCVQNDLDLEQELMNYKIEQADLIHKGTTDFYIEKTANILTQNA